MPEIQIGKTTVRETEQEGVIEYAWDGVRIYRISIQGAGGYATNSYLILDGQVTMIDVGLDGKKPRATFDRGLEVVNSRFGQKVAIEDVSGVIITHGHTDHWAMLADPRFKGKRIYAHTLDARMLRNYPKVYTEAQELIKRFVREAGWDLDVRNIFNLEHVRLQVQEYELVELADGDTIVNGYEVTHVPGHSPGHIVMKVGPVLFLGDHILSETTPHQIPGHMIPGCGLRPYLDSLHKAAALGDFFGLPAHEDSVYPIKRRVDEIEAFHHRRLADVAALCRRPKGLFQITDEYYRLRPETLNGRTVSELSRDDQILALEEIRSHVDYLIEAGLLIVSGEDNGIINYRAV